MEMTQTQILKLPFIFFFSLSGIEQFLRKTSPGSSESQCSLNVH